ncbi:MAG: citramalate synthase [Actinomycetota bacterium]|nr:citramalate synthase [Actinomycetota bacterium]
MTKSKVEVKLYDTTLRDGAQREGLSFSVEDKLKVTSKLDELGIHYIEGGWPGSNPKDIEYFKRVKGFDLKNATVVAFGSTRHKGVLAAKDKNLKQLVKAGTSTVCIFGKSWDLHVTHILITTLDDNLKMIADSVGFLKKRGLEVIYDAEHFFDGYRANPEYALRTIKVAEEAGADCIVLCDSNGGSLPAQVKSIVAEVKPLVSIPLGIHAHNDSDCAVANTLAAVEAGVVHVQGTISGYGERCGNANLISIIPNLVLKMGIPCLSEDKLALLSEVAHHVSEVANVVPDPHQPFVGESAFAHKGGVHVSAIMRQKRAYEHIDPALVGNLQRVLISEQAGAGAIVHKAKEIGIDLSNKPEQAAAILKKLKKLEYRGYHFEAADGSFEILLRKSTGSYRPLFKLRDYTVTVTRSGEAHPKTEAVVKVWVGGKRLVEFAEGNGPVNALDNALRKAIARIYPALERISLSDYKVRIINAKRGTAAVVRVLIESTDGEKTWGTVGVHENIIEASWEALVDSIEYGLMHVKEGLEKKVEKQKRVKRGDRP